MEWFKTVDKLILQMWLPRVLFIWGLFFAIAFVLILFEDLDVIREYDVPWNIALAYVLLRLPHEVLRATPMVVVLSIMATVGDMIRHNEIMVLSAVGYSVLRLVAPIAVALGVLVAFLFGMYEFVAGPCSAAAQALKETRIKGTPGMVSGAGIWLPGGNDKVFYVQNYLPYTNEIQGLSIFTFKGPDRTLSERIDAESARWLPESGRGMWVLENVVAHFILKNGEVHRERFDRHEYFIDRTPNDFERVTLEPEQMPRSELAKIVAMVKSSGEDPRMYLADLRIKEAFPFAVFFMGLLSFGLVIYTGSLGRASGLGLGLVIVIFYFLFLSMGKSFANAGLFPPWFGIWLPNFITCGMLVYVYKQILAKQ